MCLICLVRIVSEDEARQSLYDLFHSEFDKINSCGVSSIIFLALGSHGENTQRIALVQLGRYLEWFGDDKDKERIICRVLEFIGDQLFQEEFKRLVESLKDTEQLLEADYIEKNFPHFHSEIQKLGLQKFSEKIKRRGTWSRWIERIFY